MLEECRKLVSKKLSNDVIILRHSTRLQRKGSRDPFNLFSLNSGEKEEEEGEEDSRAEVFRISIGRFAPLPPPREDSHRL